MSPVAALILALVLLILNGLFVAAEFSLILARRTQLEPAETVVQAPTNEPVAYAASGNFGVGQKLTHAKFGNLLRNPMVWSTVAGFAFAVFHPPMPEVAIVLSATVPMGARAVLNALRGARNGSVTA